MKNRSDFIPTISEVLIEDVHGKLSIQIDFDFSTETIRELIFDGELKEYFLKDITFLEKNLCNLRPYDFAKILSNEKISLVLVQALQNLFNEYLGVLPVGSANDLLCACFGLTKHELQKLCTSQTLSFGEIMATTKATTGCGSCLTSIQKIYHGNAYLKERVESAIPYPSYKEWTYAESLIMIDDLRLEFLKERNLPSDFFIISGSKEWKLDLKSDSNVDVEMKKEFSLYVFSRTGLLISFFN